MFYMSFCQKKSCYLWEIKYLFRERQNRLENIKIWWKPAKGLTLHLKSACYE